MTVLKKKAKPHWIAKEISRIRNERGWSQLKLADLSDTTQAALANFESGKANMHLVRVDRVLDALGYEIDIHVKS